MKHLTLLFAALFISIGMMAQTYDYDFASKCSSGQTLYYKILSSNPPQAELVFGDPAMQSVDLIIPEMAADTTNTFRLYEVVSIADDAFDDYYGEETGALVIPNTVLSIGSRAFYYMSLTSLSLPESLESIGSEAFAYNSNMTGPLVIPQSVVSIGQGAFAGCGFTSLDWPALMTEIPKSCFYGCRFQGTLSLPEGVTEIRIDAFGICQELTGLELPSTLTSIGDMAFVACSGLTFIKIDAVTPPYSPSSVFVDVDKSIPVYVPYGTKQLYEEDPAWKYFTNIIDDPDSVEEVENEGFEIYPNPVADQLHVSCQGLNSVAVYDVQGRKIISMETENENACLDFSDMLSGVYFIEAFAADHRRHVFEILRK